MTNAQIYCTLDELIADLSLNGDEPGLFSRIQTASRFINRRFKNFIPVLATKLFQDQGGGRDLRVDPLLQVNQVLNNGFEIIAANYELHPLNRCWENGPYTRIYSEYAGWDDDDIRVTGLWGKWLQPEGLGIDVTQLVNATTIAVTDGSMLSIGLVLSLEDEQQLVTGLGSPTVITAQLAADITNADEEIIIDDGTEVHEGEVIQISTEKMQVRMIAGNTLVVARGWSGTTRQAHAENAAVSVYRTFTVERGVNGTVAAAHDNQVLSRYVPPEDINWLCRQIAGLMHMKAKSNFAGKVGNAEMGETFYFNEFPSQVKEISRNYRIVQL